MLNCHKQFDKSCASVGEQMTRCWNAAAATVNSIFRACLHGPAHVMRFIAALLVMLADALEVLDSTIQQRSEADFAEHELDQYITPLSLSQIERGIDAN